VLPVASTFRDFATVDRVGVGATVCDARFGGGLTEANEKNVVVIIAVGNRTLGILVDTVSDILTVGSSEIKPSPETNTGQNEKFVSGLIAVEGRMVVLLDIEMLLANDAHMLESVKA
jgi:purine-binding chemotaxis protein CheW